MRLSAVILAAVIGLAVSGMSAGAAPTVASPAPPQLSNIVQIAGGCGSGFHRTRRGYCTPNRYGYYRPHPYWRAYRPGYYGDGHEPWNHPTPGDHVANQLNRQQARGGGYWY